jgi:hypothetical protein
MLRCRYISAGVLLLDNGVVRYQKRISRTLACIENGSFAIPFNRVFSVRTLRSVSPFVAGQTVRFDTMTYGEPWIAKISDNISMVVVDVGGLQHILISAHLDFASITIKKIWSRMLDVYTVSVSLGLNPMDVLAPSQDWSLPQRMVGKFLTVPQCLCPYLSSRRIGVQVVSSL